MSKADNQPVTVANLKEVLSDQFASFEERFELKIDKKIDDLEVRIETKFDAKLEALEARLDTKFDIKLNDLESRLKTHMQDVVGYHTGEVLQAIADVVEPLQKQVKIMVTTA